MTDRLVVDLETDGAVRVTAELEGDPPSTTEATPLTWPLDDDALEDLRWYLEDYLRAPYGVYEDRGARIAGELNRWGQAVFEAVFGSGPARDAYLKMRAYGEPELVIRSSTASLLGLPWELMAAPDSGTPLALAIAGVSRALPTPSDAVETVPVSDGRLRVLMVISRPTGTGDVGYRMIARPLLEQLEAVRGTVNLVVLRPPTLDALRSELTAALAAGEPYQVVHFDGHGAFLGLKTSDIGEGVLVFEHPTGGPDHVPAWVIAKVLADAKIPVVVLNACQSGAVGKALEAAVATRLLREGVASVVAMAYSVYAKAAAEFMAAFYDRLFAGGTVASAVTAGRHQLFRTPGRPSPKGDLPLADWLVPVHYFRREVSFPQAAPPRLTKLQPSTHRLAELIAETEQASTGELDPVDGVFIGRDALFYDLETAARLQKVIILAGTAGTGKTELAKAFGRWWRDTGGAEQPDWVFWHSFLPGVASFGLDDVINKIGQGLWGAQFALQDAAQRHDAVRQALAEHRMLLIWDNFESVRSMPDQGRATPPLDEAGCTEIREFLANLSTQGQSAVLITSRAKEDWLGAVHRIEIGGLTYGEAVQYADKLLEAHPIARQHRADRAFAELMEWLGGHPLTMRVILPHLTEATPQTLLASLRGAAPMEVNGEEHASLRASIAYSYAHLSARTRVLLPAVSLLHGVADVEALRWFSEEQGAPKQFIWAAKDDWKAALDDATRVGLLTRLSRDLYRVHPALPSFLASIWREEADDYDNVRDAAIRALLPAYAVVGDWLVEQVESGDAARAHSVMALEQNTLGSLLGYALNHQLFEEAQHVAQPLYHYWTAQGLGTEVDAWASRAREATEDQAGDPPPLNTHAGSLWLFFTSAQGNREWARGHLGEAERCYLKMLYALQATDPWAEGQRYKGIAYHQLGVVAEGRGVLDEAEGWYRKSLAIKEEAGDRPGTVKAYQQIGAVAVARRRFSEAEVLYRNALVIAEDIGDRLGMGISYSQLGRVAAEQGRLDDAERWLRSSLAVVAEVDDRQGMTIDYHLLGNVALLGGRLGMAEEWYLKALPIAEETGNPEHLASTYYQLGVVAQSRGALSEAKEWYRKALSVAEAADDGQKTAAALLGALALLAEEQGQLHEALTWAVRCVARFDQFPHPAAMPAQEVLARLAAILGVAALADTWIQVTGDPLPWGVRKYMQDFLGRNNGLRPGSGRGGSGGCTTTYPTVRLPARSGGRGSTAQRGRGEDADPVRRPDFHRDSDREYRHPGLGNL